MNNDKRMIPDTQPNKPGHPDRNGPQSELAVDPHTGEKVEQGSHVRIANHHKSTVGLPPITKHNKETEVTETIHGDKHLAPGESNVNAEHWAMIKDKSPVRDFIRAGLISEVDGGDTSKPEGASRSALDNMPEGKAVHAVGNMTEHDDLVAAQSDKRPAVAQAASRKLESLGVKK